MLSISTIPEALAELEKQTGRAWTDSELFDLAANSGIELHAAPPITAKTTIQKFVDGVGLVEKFRSPPGHAALAVLFPWQVGQLWLSGETLTSHPSKHDEIEGEYKWFTEPVRVTREQVRIKAATLQKLFTAWRKSAPLPAQTAATPAPVVAVGALGDDEPWKEQARARAYEIIKRDREKDLYPNQMNIADEIAKEFRRDGLTGADGKPLSGASIKRHALKGISSAQSKLVSTVTRRGK